MRHRAEGHHGLLAFDAQGFSGAQDEGHSLPAPVVYLHFHLGERFGAPGRVDAVLPGVVRDLPAADGSGRVPGAAGAPGVGRLDAAGPQHRGHGVAEVPLVHRGRRFERHQGHDLQEVALDHVAEGAGAVVITGASLQREVLVKDNLDLCDVLAVPHRLQEGVGEAQPQDVQHRRLAQEMVHPVDVDLRDQGRQGNI